MNNKGFTLIELLAVITILSILMVIAVPNIVSVVKRSRDKTMVDDAKKMISMTKYYITKNQSKKEGKFYLTDIDDSKEIVEGPNNGEYERDKSYVEVTNTDGYQYSVCLQEHKNANYYVLQKDEESLYNDKPSSLVELKTSSTCS